MFLVKHPPALTDVLCYFVSPTAACIPSQKHMGRLLYVSCTHMKELHHSSKGPHDGSVMNELQLFILADREFKQPHCVNHHK